MEVELPTPTLVVPASPSSRSTPAAKKRRHDGELIVYDQVVSTPSRLPTNRASVASGGGSHPATPDLSMSSTPLTKLDSTPVLSPDPAMMDGAADAPDGKKRKLTFAEQEVERAVKRREKEEREQQKADAKAKKEEEKKRKDDEKEAFKKAREAEKEEKEKAKEAEREEREKARKAKEAEKEEKEKAKEAKRKEKEEVKKAKEGDRLKKVAEAQKKDRAQMRIGAFFGKPATTASPLDLPDDCSLGARSRRSSVSTVNLEPAFIESKVRPVNTEFDKWILPFFVGDHMDLAPNNRFLTNDLLDGQEASQLLFQSDSPPKAVRTRFQRRRRARHIPNVKEIVEKVLGADKTPIALPDCQDPLASVPTKYLFFHTDVRPPYSGTYTRPVSPRTARKIACKPDHRGLPDTNYDYDSEAEWQPPEEGDEDLMSDDEKSEEGDDKGDMEDFLDDEGEVIRRQIITSDMEPICSGLCWDGETRPVDFDLESYRIDSLHDMTTFPIDPYATSHWSDMGRPSPTKANSTSAEASMQPPRLPLAAVDGNGSPAPPASIFNLGTQKSENQPGSLKPANATAKPPKMIPQDVLPAFKQAVAGNTLTKTGLIEVLKNQFPQCPKDAIKDTLGAVAVRQGKVWVLI